MKIVLWSICCHGKRNCLQCGSIWPKVRFPLHHVAAYGPKYELLLSASAEARQSVPLRVASCDRAPKRKTPAGAGVFSVEVSLPVPFLLGAVVLRVAVRASAAGVRVVLRHLIERRLLGRAMPNRPAFRNAALLLGHALHLLSQCSDSTPTAVGSCAGDRH